MRLSKMSEAEIERLRKQFKLVDHPEGGMFAEVWRGEKMVTFTEKTAHDGPRNVGSCIYFLLKAPNFVSWHKIISDEFLYWHAGGTLRVHFIDSEGRHSSVLMGDGLKNAECGYHVRLPPAMWYACELIDGDYVFYSATVMPGFEFKDWLPGKKDEMIKEFSQHADLVTRLAKQ